MVASRAAERTFGRDVAAAEEAGRATVRDVLAKGGDWRIHEIVGREDVESWGGRVARLRVVRGARTSALVAGVR